MRIFFFIVACFFVALGGWASGEKEPNTFLLAVTNSSYFDARFDVMKEDDWLRAGSTTEIEIPRYDNELTDGFFVDYKVPLSAKIYVIRTGAEKIHIGKDQKTFKLPSLASVVEKESFFSVFNDSEQTIRVRDGNTALPFLIQKGSNYGERRKHEISKETHEISKVTHEIHKETTEIYQYQVDANYNIKKINSMVAFPDFTAERGVLYRFIFDGESLLLIDARPLLKLGDFTWSLTWDSRAISINAIIPEKGKKGYYVAGSITNDGIEQALLLFVSNNGDIIREKTFQKKDGIPIQTRINDLALTGGKIVAVGSRREWDSDKQEFASVGWVQYFGTNFEYEKSFNIKEVEEFTTVAASRYKALAGGSGHEGELKIYYPSESKSLELGEKNGRILKIVSSEGGFTVLGETENEGFVFTVKKDRISKEVTFREYSSHRVFFQTAGDGLFVLGAKKLPDGKDAGFIASLVDRQGLEWEEILFGEDYVFHGGGSNPFLLNTYLLNGTHRHSEKIFHFDGERILADFPLELPESESGTGFPANDFGYVSLSDKHLARIRVSGGEIEKEQEYQPLPRLFYKNPDTNLESLDFTAVGADKVHISFKPSTRTKVKVEIAPRDKNNKWIGTPITHIVSDAKITLSSLYPGRKYKIALTPLDKTHPKEGGEILLYEHKWTHLEDGYDTFVQFDLKRKKPKLPTGEGHYQVVGRNFRIAPTELSLGDWKAIYNWAIKNGYTFDNKGKGMGADYPVTNISWYDAVVWCNAASEKYGFIPVFRTKRGEPLRHSDRKTVPIIKMEADGFRLPTQAEWILAAGGKERADGHPYSGEDFHVDSAVPREVGKSMNINNVSDMSGNVTEWCLESRNAMSPTRGGHFQSTIAEARIYEPPNWHEPHTVSDVIGFRPLRIWIDSLILVKREDSIFYLSATELSWREWETERNWAEENGYKGISKGQMGATGEVNDQHPVTMVNWLDAVVWCNAKSEKNGLTPVYLYQRMVLRDIKKVAGDYMAVVRDKGANGYRLPTSDEWIIAARAGGTSRFSGSDDIKEVTLSNNTTSPVTMDNISSNAFGFWQMSGNVAEWCSDIFSGDGSKRLLRGGSSQPGDPYLELDKSESKRDATERSKFLGFRIARSGYGLIE